MSLRHGWQADMTPTATVVCDSCGVRADGFELSDDALRELGWSIEITSKPLRRTDVCALCVGGTD